MVSREIAKRVFTAELKQSLITYRAQNGDDSQYAPTYVVTPTGERCNRILLMGRVVAKENVNDESGRWRCKVEDATGSIYVYAGMYQPHAATVISQATEGDHIAIVGKPVVVTLTDGSSYVIIRAELANIVDEMTYIRWAAETAMRTYQRLAIIRETIAGSKDTEEHRIARAAYDFYSGDSNVSRIYESMDWLRAAVRNLKAALAGS